MTEIVHAADRGIDASLLELLGEGKDAARSSFDLAQKLEVNQRAIGFMVSRLRKAGHLIGSVHGGGYYLITSRAELDETIHHIEIRKRGIDATIAALRGSFESEEQAVEVHLYSDGGMSPAPCYGFVIRDVDGMILDQSGRVLPDDVTSNEAEWCGLIAGLYRCRELGARVVRAHGDSQLVMRQASGQYAVRAENLIEFHGELRRLVREFERVTFKWIPRAQNALADDLGRQACEAAAE